MMLLHLLLLLCAFPSSNGKGRLRQFHIGEVETNRTDAVRNCSKSYTDLVTVYDQQDNLRLKRMLNNTMSSGWIGAFIGKHSKKWSNGDEVRYTQDFGTNYETQCCAAMDADGKWTCIQCNENRSFMCYKDVGQALFNYSLIPENKTWFEAQLYCRENHTDLVSIRNETENERVREAGNNCSTPFWIGLLEDNVEWNDEGQSAYRNWFPNELIKNGTIIDVNGDWQTSTGNHIPLCYKSLINVSSSSMSWENAVDYCNNQSDTSGLLRIESKDDQIETERELKRLNISETLWVGLRQSRLFGFWIWNNGLHVGPWTNWKGGSTPEHMMSGHCGALEKVNGQYKWCDKDCRSEFRVLCERKNPMP